MIDAQIRHRPVALLACVVVAQILLLAFQIKRDRDVPLIRVWAVDLITPVGRAGTWTSLKLRGIWRGYIALHGARVENERLKSELGGLQLRNRELETQAGEAERLRVLLNFRDEHPEAAMLAAQVIGASADPTSHTLFVNRGERDHVRRNMAVITPDGVVGKIVEVFSNNTSQVLLMNDKEMGVGSLLADTRTHGVVKGTGDPLPFMDYVVDDEKVHYGEAILTSGEDRIFPKGLPVGFVTDTTPGVNFQTIHVQPAVRLDRVEDVLILLTRQDIAVKPVADAGDATAAPAAAGAQPNAQPSAAPPQSPGASAPTAQPKPSAPSAPEPR
jgi:rod shape-determining protein MreC